MARRVTDNGYTRDDLVLEALFDEHGLILVSNDDGQAFFLPANIERNDPDAPFVEPEWARNDFDGVTWTLRHPSPSIH